MKRKKEIFILIATLLLIITVIYIYNYIEYTRSDEYKLREFTTEIKKCQDDKIKLISVKINDEKKELRIVYNTNRTLELDEYNEVRNAFDIYRKEVPSYYNTYKIEIWIQNLKNGDTVNFSNLCYVDGINDKVDNSFSNMQVSNFCDDEFAYISNYNEFTDLQTLQIEYLVLDDIEVLKKFFNLKYLCSENDLTEEELKQIKEVIPQCNYKKYDVIYTCPSAIVD